MRVDGAAETGTVKVALAFDDWKDGKVAPATFELPLAPRADKDRR